MYLSKGRGYVTGSFADEELLPLESEILSINGEPLKDIVSRLEDLTSADGLNQAFRSAKVNQHFPLKYAVAYDLQDSFLLRYVIPGEPGIKEITLSPVSKTLVDQSRSGNPELSFQELEPGRIGLLTINSFAYYGQVNWFKSFMDSVFTLCKEVQIEELILDLRGNGGGDPFCSSYLWAYLQPEPVPYFEDHYGRYDTLANPIPQPANHFTGRLFTLIDGLGFSTTGHFCGLLKYHDVGEFVGSETGASYTCTGNATYPALDHSGIMVGTARVMRYTAAVKDMDPLRGIIPDHPVEITPRDLIQGKDPVLEHALSLIRGQ
jgi:C-terminal processing protease CtpA/Prc